MTALMLVGNLLGMFDALGEDSALQAIFVIPVPLQEIVLALLLIFKGFDRSAPRIELDPAADRVAVSV